VRNLRSTVELIQFNLAGTILAGELDYNRARSGDIAKV